MDRQQIGQQIRNYRTKVLGLSQRQFAKKFRFSLSKVSKMETGFYAFTDLTLARLAKRIPDLRIGEK